MRQVADTRQIYFGSRKCLLNELILFTCAMCMRRLELTKVDSVTQWLVDVRCLTDSECQCVLQGKSLTADTAETVVSPPKLISGQLHWCIWFEVCLTSG